MPKYLNEDLRNKLVVQSAETYFPAETEIMARESMAALFRDYCEKAYGPVPPFVNNNCTYSILLGPDSQPVTFNSFWFRAPFLQVRDSSRRYSPKMDVNIDICPVPGLIDTARALEYFKRSRLRFSESLYGELLKYATVETFLRRFPALEGAFAMVVGEKQASDLPVECEVDVGAIAEFLTM